MEGPEGGDRQPGSLQQESSQQHGEGLNVCCRGATPSPCLQQPSKQAGQQRAHQLACIDSRATTAHAYSDHLGTYTGATAMQTLQSLHGPSCLGPELQVLLNLSRRARAFSSSHSLQGHARILTALSLTWKLEFVGRHHRMWLQQQGTQTGACLRRCRSRLRCVPTLWTAPRDSPLSATGRTPHAQAPAGKLGSLGGVKFCSR